MDSKEELIQWKGFVDNCKPLEGYIEERLELLNSQLERLALSPGLDNAFLVTEKMARVMELKNLRQEMEYKIQLYKEEILNHGNPTG